MIVNGYTIAPRANLRGADLQDANLRSVDLHGAKLRGANLHGADLRGADLQDADLQDADLYGAKLYGADLRGADLHGAHLVGSIDAFSVGDPDEYRIVVVQHQDGIRIGAGCRWFTWKAANVHWHPRYKGKDRAATRAALKYIKDLCRIKGFKLGRG